jgi:hypothetical protein
LEHHSANQFLKVATNLNVVQPKLFQASRQDDLRFSDCTVSVIQILDDADAAFRILGAGLRTVLSVITMFADKPHRLNGRTSAQRFCVLTILPPVTALAVGLPAQRAIAQRFRALAHSGRSNVLVECPLLREQQTYWCMYPRGNVAVFGKFISAHYSILISHFYCLLVGQS